MKQKLNEYKKKVGQQNIHYQLLFSSLQNIAKQKILTQINQLYQAFRDLSLEKQTIQYYISKQQVSHIQQKGSFKENLSPIFKVIDQKLCKNEKIINSFSCKISYPNNSKQSVSQSLFQIKNQLMQNQLAEIKKILFYNPSLKKYMKKQLQQIQNIHNKYQKLFKISTQMIYTPLLKLKGSIQEVMSNLIAYKNIQEIDISIKQPNGIISLDHYKKLGQGIYKHHKIATKISIKLSDMQFSQQKCDALKKLIKECKYLNNVRIQNYYKQCKLGLFQDFNWLPFKKQTHVIGKIW